MQLQQGASFPVLGASNPGLLHSLPGPALLFCPARVQGLSSFVLQLVEGRAGILTRLTLGPALLPTSVVKG